ncbi:MAG: leucine-rich repeat domain-containing protein [Clostridiales bacterium]|nr:leucine-rich repeat domain-containing protein [Clostridiales bacterium]
MKKKITILAVLIVSLLACLSLLACEHSNKPNTPNEPDNPTHSHSYGDWKHDEANHWKECSGCDEKSEQGEHNFSGDNKCICGYDKKSNAEAPTIDEIEGIYYLPSFNDDTNDFELTKDWYIQLNSDGTSIMTFLAGGWPSETVLTYTLKENMVQFTLMDDDTDTSEDENFVGFINDGTIVLWEINYGEEDSNYDIMAVFCKEGIDIPYKMYDDILYCRIFGFEFDGTFSVVDVRKEIISASIKVEIDDISVTSIGARAFNDCDRLESITIPDNVINIGDYAFWHCDGLKNVTIGNGVINIGKYAFYECSSLESVTIGYSLTSICESAFRACDSLESITISKTNSVYHSDGNCIIETATKTLVLGCKTSIIPDDGSVTSIGRYAFAYCSSLESVTISDSVTSIGSHAFYGCKNLQNIIFKNATGWQIDNNLEIDESLLSDSSTAAKYLVSTYSSYDWSKAKK